MDRGKEKRGQVQSQVYQEKPINDDEVRWGLKESKEVTESTLPRKAAIVLFIPVP